MAKQTPSTDQAPAQGSPASFFTDPAVAEKYTAPQGRDTQIHIPLLYSGLLSNITVEVAAALVAMEDNQVEEKK
jgi:hypothetical protein